MTEDLSEVYNFVFLPDGKTIDKPQNCSRCQFIIANSNLLDVRVCPICNHLYERSSNTPDENLGECWCVGLVKNRYIERIQDYPEFYKKCLLDSLPRLEIIGITCDICKRKKACEDGGTNTSNIKEIMGCCEDIKL